MNFTQQCMRHQCVTQAIYQLPGVPYTGWFRPDVAVVTGESIYWSNCHDHCEYLVYLQKIEN